MAHAVARDALAAYAHRCSPKKFTQPQLFACLVLKEFYKSDYRQVCQTLADSADLREAIGLKEAPHFTTLHKASKRLLIASLVKRVMDQLIRLAVKAKLIKPKVTALAAVDSSGLESHHVSQYFVRRCKAYGKTGPKQAMTYHRFPKLAIVGDCQSHLILAAAALRGPQPDILHLEDLIIQAAWRRTIRTALLEAGYDAQDSHRLLRLDLNIRSLIPPKAGRPTNKKPAGYFRRLMRRLLDGSQRGKPYGQRAQVATIFRMIKRRLGETLGARSYGSQCRALLLKVITHNVMIPCPHSGGFSTEPDGSSFAIRALRSSGRTARDAQRKSHLWCDQLIRGGGSHLILSGAVYAEWTGGRRGSIIFV